MTSLVQFMACCLSGAQSLNKTIQTYSQLVPWHPTSVLSEKYWTLSRFTANQRASYMYNVIFHSWSSYIPALMWYHINFLQNTPNKHFISDLFKPYRRYPRLLQILTEFLHLSLLWFCHCCDFELCGVHVSGNIFHVTGHLCGEFTGPRWIPRTKASDMEL